VAVDMRSGSRLLKRIDSFSGFLLFLNMTAIGLGLLLSDSFVEKVLLVILVVAAILVAFNNPLSKTQLRIALFHLVVHLAFAIAKNSLPLVVSALAYAYSWAVIPYGRSSNTMSDSEAQHADETSA
jgi:hypothetical protein